MARWRAAGSASKSSRSAPISPTASASRKPPAPSSPRRSPIPRLLAAGVKTGDVITSVNGEQVADPKELARKIALLGPKTTAELGIIRNGAAQTISVKLGAMAGEKEAKAETTTSQPGEPTQLARLGLTVEPAQRRP